MAPPFQVQDIPAGASGRMESHLQSHVKARVFFKAVAGLGLR